MMKIATPYMQNIAFPGIFWQKYSFQQVFRHDLYYAVSHSKVENHPFWRYESMPYCWHKGVGQKTLTEWYVWNSFVNRCSNLLKQWFKAKMLIYFSVCYLDYRGNLFDMEIGIKVFRIENVSIFTQNGSFFYFQNFTLIKSLCIKLFLYSELLLRQLTNSKYFEEYTNVFEKLKNVYQPIYRHTKNYFYSMLTSFLDWASKASPNRNKWKIYLGHRDQWILQKSTFNILFRMILNVTITCYKFVGICSGKFVIIKVER